MENILFKVSVNRIQCGSISGPGVMWNISILTAKNIISHKWQITCEPWPRWLRESLCVGRGHYYNVVYIPKDGSDIR